MPLNFSYCTNPSILQSPARQSQVLERLSALRRLAASDDPTNGALGRAAAGIDPMPLSPPGAPGVIFVLMVDGVPAVQRATYRHLVRFGGTFYRITTQSDGSGTGACDILGVALVPASVGAGLMVQAMPANRPMNHVPGVEQGQAAVDEMSDGPGTGEPLYGNAPQPLYGNAPAAPLYGNAPAQPLYGNAPQPLYGNAPAPTRPTITRGALRQLLRRFG